MKKQNVIRMGIEEYYNEQKEILERRNVIIEDCIKYTAKEHGVPYHVTLWENLAIEGKTSEFGIKNPEQLKRILEQI